MAGEVSQDALHAQPRRRSLSQNSESPTQGKSSNSPCPFLVLELGSTPFSPEASKFRFRTLKPNQSQKNVSLFMLNVYSSSDSFVCFLLLFYSYSKLPFFNTAFCLFLVFFFLIEFRGVILVNKIIYTLSFKNAEPAWLVRLSG